MVLKTLAGLLPMDLNDETLRRYREKRMQELLGVAEISTEADLIEKTKNLTMVVHFYKPEFKRCAVMDRRLTEIRGDLPAVHFYRVNADICPVVCARLEVRVLPFLGFFKEGYFVDQMVGFEKLGDDFDAAALKRRILESNLFRPVSSLE